MKKIAERLISAMLAAVLIFTCCTGAFAASEKYVSDVKVATGKTVEEAAQKLTEAGYTPINSDLNSGNGTAVVLGYTTTLNANEAITDLAIMKEKGGYSFTEYEDILEEQKTEVAELIDNLKAAIDEYRENYDAEMGAAVLAHDVMNLVTNDDLDNKGMGDVFYDEETTTEQLQTAFLQGNTEVVTCLGMDLAIACFGSESFLDALADADTDKTYPLDIDADAKMLLDKVSDFQKDMNKLIDLGIIGEEDDEKLETIFDEATDDEKSHITDAYPVYSVTSSTEYKGTTLYDFLMGDIDEMETADFYPIIDSMTAGQRSSLQYVSLSQIIQFTVTEDESWAEQYEVYKKNADLDSSDTVSLFVNVDRSIYEANGIALTSDALIKQNADNDVSWTNRGASESLKKAALYTLCAGVGVSLMGSIIALYVYTQVSPLITEAAKFAASGIVKLTGHVYEMGVVEAAQDLTSVFAGAGAVFTLICIAAVLFYVAVQIYDKVKKSKAHPVYSEIPRILVDEAIDENENSIYTFYYCATDTDGNLADLNAWNGTKWNGLYYTKDKDAGKPITVTNAVQMGKGNNTAPSNEYEGVHFFGESTAYNLNADSNYKKTVADSNYTYLFFVHAKASSTASVFSDYGYYALAAFAGLLVGCGFTMIIANKKKKKVVTA